jgi:hypothetical protein
MTPPDDRDDVPPELYDDRARQLRDLAEDRIASYVELAAGAARAWDQGRYDAKRLVEDANAWWTLGMRDLLTAWTWWTDGAGPARTDADVPRPGHCRQAVPITAPPAHTMTIGCSDLVHVHDPTVVIPRHAVTISPNPVTSSTSSVLVSFSSFGKPTGAYVGQLLAHGDDQQVLGEIVIYVQQRHARA